MLMSESHIQVRMILILLKQQVNLFSKSKLLLIQNLAKTMLLAVNDCKQC